MSAPVAAVLGSTEEDGDIRRPSMQVVRNADEDVTYDPTHTAHAHHDDVTFEEYYYWAEITRAEEQAANEHFLAARGPRTLKAMVKDRFATGSKAHEAHAAAQAAQAAAVADAPSNDDSSPTEKSPIGDEKASDKGSNKEKSEALGAGEGVITGVTPEEWKQASRAMRTASWGSVFYLITTDILGPFSTPWAFAQMGYGPGVALFTVFGCMSLYSGWIMWQTFLGVDSDKYPAKGYGDLYYRVWGPISRHIINFMQSLQLLLSVSILILSNGQSISQISQGPNSGTGICFVACLIIFMVAGFILGQIRTLQRFSWIANISVWINLLIIFICMGVVAHSEPNFTATESSYGSNFGPGTVKTYAGTPPDGMASGGTGFVASLNGLDQAVYSYGGCMIFATFLSEMRHPHDFWKSLIIAETFIYVVYMVFGIYVYSFQGQYSFNPVMQGLSPYNWQTATNIMNLITGLIAAALYGNIGIKVLYIEVLQELFGFPPLTIKSGKIIWSIAVPIYWIIAFIVGAAIPQFSYISSFVGAMFILSFTYTLPALLAFGFWIRKDAMLPEERFDPNTRTYSFVDRGFARHWRAFKKKPIFNTWNAFYFLGSLCTTALGMYSAIEGLISAFSGGSVATSFGCATPV